MIIPPHSHYEALSVLTMLTLDDLGYRKYILCSLGEAADVEDSMSLPLTSLLRQHPRPPLIHHSKLGCMGASMRLNRWGSGPLNLPRICSTSSPLRLSVEETGDKSPSLKHLRQFDFPKGRQQRLSSHISAYSVILTIHLLSSRSAFPSLEPKQKSMTASANRVRVDKTLCDSQDQITSVLCISTFFTWYHLGSTWLLEPKPHSMKSLNCPRRASWRGIRSMATAPAELPTNNQHQPASQMNKPSWKWILLTAPLPIHPCHFSWGTFYITLSPNGRILAKADDYDCFKPLSLGMICYAAINNWFNTYQHLFLLFFFVSLSSQGYFFIISIVIKFTLHLRFPIILL